MLVTRSGQVQAATQPLLIRIRIRFQTWVTVARESPAVAILFLVVSALVAIFGFQALVDGLASRRR
jgi:hypothetical protein